jgi:sentrin-specific protease 1
MISFVPLEIGEFEEFVRKQREKGALVKLGPVREKEVVKINGSSGALTTLIDVMEREGVEGRESFLVREYWRPYRLVSFKTFATPLLYMGRRERKIAPNKSKILNIAQDKLCQLIRSRVEVMKIMRPLTAEERRMVVRATAMGKGTPLEILASHKGDSVKRRSMQTLRPGIWLNDEVINYFLKNCLKNRDIKKCAKEQGRRRSHFFNSFFVQSMFDEKNRNRKLRRRYNYENVKKWSKKVPGKDIFNLKYIFCPINVNKTHWTVAVIFMEDKRIQYYDSFGNTDMAKLNGLLQYVKDEYRAKNGKEMAEMDAMEWKLVPCQNDTPQQKNGELYLSVLG